MQSDTPSKQNPRTGSFEFSTGLRSQLNVLILLHILFFAAYCIIGWNGMLSLPWDDGTLDDHIRNSLAVSSRTQDWPSNWTISMFTYQFVHLSAGELLLSISMLWLFGHMLKTRMGQGKVIIFYFAVAFLSGLVFNLSHLVFPIYSGPGGFMEGAFGGVLGLMTAGVLLHGSHQFRIGRHISFQLWQVYSIALLLSFMIVYKNNIAYVLVYACSMYMGIRFARMEERRTGEEEEAAVG